jgi:hypothetical protein
MHPALRAAVLGAAQTLTLTLAASSGAAVISVPDSVDDFEAQRRSDTGVYIASENFATGSRVGFQSNFNGTGASAPGGITSLYFFQLPSLAPGESVAGAVFGVGRLPDSAASAAAPTFNADLFALGVVSAVDKSADAAQKFFYLGNTAQAALPAGGPAVGGSVSRVTDDFLRPGDFITNGGSPSGGPNTADLTAYLQGLYADPAANGFTPGTSYLVLRLNPDADAVPTTGTQRYTTAFQGTAANGGAGTPENRPLLTLTTSVVPEPAAASLVIVGALGLVRRRSRA